MKHETTNLESDTPTPEAPKRCMDYSIVFAAGAVVALAAALIEMWMSGRVESAQPAGTVRSIRAGGGWGVRLIVETETTFYPLHSALAIDKGAALIRQVRANGEVYLCEASMRSCAKTASQAWSSNRMGGKE